MAARRNALMLLVVISLAFLTAVAWAGEEVPPVSAAEVLSAPAPAAPSGKSLTLEAAVALAIRNNPSVEIANQEIRANTGIVMQAESLAYPQVNVATSRTTPVDQPAFSFQGAGTNWQTDISLTQTLWTWGAVKQGIRAADELLSSSRKLYVRAQDQVAFNARRAYFAVLTAQEAVRVQYAILAAAREQLRVATLRHEAGVAPKYDVLSAEARVARVLQQVATAAGAVNVAWANLSQVLGVPVSPDTDLVTTRPETSEVPPLPELVSFALVNRPDVLAARALVTANEARLAVARTGKLPRIVGLMSYSYLPDTTLSLDGESEVTLSQDSGFVALALDWDVFDGGQTIGEVTSAAARLEQSCQSLRQLQLQVEAEVKTAYYVIETTRTQITAATKEVEQAQEAKRVADIRYQEGVSTSLEVLDAQQNLGDAQNRLNAAIFNLNVARAELDLSAGRSLAEAIPPGPRKTSELCTK